MSDIDETLFGEADGGHDESQSEPKRSKVCAVCGGISDTYHLNYGASVCLSCRAFFRRIVQRGKCNEPSFTCKSGSDSEGACEISVKSRRKCQACRFAACLRAGMKATSVLDDTQKVERFRKMLKKRHGISDGRRKRLDSDVSLCGSIKISMVRRKKADPFASSLSTPYSSLRSVVSDYGEFDLPSVQAMDSQPHQHDASYADYTQVHIPAHRSHPHSSAGSYGVRHHRIPEQQQQQLISTPSPYYDSAKIFSDGSKPSGPRVWQMPDQYQGYSSDLATFASQDAALMGNIDSSLDRDILQVDQAWAQARSNAYDKKDGKYFSSMVNFLSGCGEMPREAIRAVVSALESAFLDFAMKQSSFTSLSQDDQFELLSRNTPMLVQYVLGRCATAASATEQLQWLFGMASPWQNSWELAYQTANSGCLLLIDGVLRRNAPLQRYKNLSEGLQRAFNVPPRYLFSVALVVLFFSDDNTPLVQPQRVLGCATNSITLVTNSVVGNNFDKITMCSILGEMASIFERNVGWNEEEEASISMNPESALVPLPFTVEESVVSHRISNRFDAAFKKVSFGEELFKEYLQFCFDVPYSKKTIARGPHVFAEKMWSVLKTHHEFEELPLTQQMALWKSSAMDSAALTIAKMHSFKTPMEQFNFCWGMTDFENWANNFNGVVDLSKLKLVSFSDSNRCNPVIPLETMNRFDELMEGLFDLVSDDTQFRMLTLIVMFSNTSISGAVSQIRNNYVTLFRRQLREKLGVEGADATIASFMSKVEDVKEISKIFLMFTQSALLAEEQEQ